MYNGCVCRVIWLVFVSSRWNFSQERQQYIEHTLWTHPQAVLGRAYRTWAGSGNVAHLSVPASWSASRGQASTKHKPLELKPIRVLIQFLQISTGRTVPVISAGGVSPSTLSVWVVAVRAEFYQCFDATVWCHQSHHYRIGLPTNYHHLQQETPHVSSQFIITGPSKLNWSSWHQITDSVQSAFWWIL